MIHIPFWMLAVYNMGFIMATLYTALYEQTLIIPGGIGTGSPTKTHSTT